MAQSTGGKKVCYLKSMPFPERFMVGLESMGRLAGEEPIRNLAGPQGCSARETSWSSSPESASFSLPRQALLSCSEGCRALLMLCHMEDVSYLLMRDTRQRETMSSGQEESFFFPSTAPLPPTFRLVIFFSLCSSEPSLYKSISLCFKSDMLQ